MPPDYRIELAIPAQPEFLRVARVTASGLASRLGFGIDDVDDLRLALDELCFAVIGKGIENQALSLTYDLGETSLVINGSVQTSELKEVGELSRQILTALVNDHRVWSEDGSSKFRLEKRWVKAAPL